MPKKKLSQADAAYLRQEELLAGRTPVPEGVLPGQIDMLDGSVAGFRNVDPAPDREYTKLDAIPERCTKCDKLMTLNSGWTPMKPEEDRRIQCGACGEIIVVPQGSYDTLSLALRNRFANIDRYVPKLTREKKSRGAG